MFLEPDKLMQLMASCEMAPDAISVLKYSSDQVGGHADVKRAPYLVRHDIRITSHRYFNGRLRASFYMDPKSSLG